MGTAEYVKLYLHGVRLPDVAKSVRFILTMRKIRTLSYLTPLRNAGLEDWSVASWARLRPSSSRTIRADPGVSALPLYI